MLPKLGDLPSMKSVRSIPGSTTSERMPCGANSCAKPPIQPSSANFDGEYSAPPALETNPLTDETVMTRPDRSEQVDFKPTPHGGISKGLEKAQFAVASIVD